MICGEDWKAQQQCFIGYFNNQRFFNKIKMTEKPIPCGNNVDQNAISLKATHQKPYLE